MRNKAMNSSVQEQKKQQRWLTRETPPARTNRKSSRVSWCRDRAGTENSTKNPSGSKLVGAESTVGMKTSGRRDLCARPMGNRAPCLVWAPAAASSEQDLVTNLGSKTEQNRQQEHESLAKTDGNRACSERTKTLITTRQNMAGE
jgi:hypothetical protein